MKSILLTGALGLAVIWSRVCAAEEPCAGSLQRSNLVECALSFSPALREARSTEKVMVARREAARPFLPANPALSGSVSSRTGRAEVATNWTVALGQEFEVAGQSGVRVAVADAELHGQEHRVEAVRADLAAATWNAYFAVLAGQERNLLSRRLETATRTVAETARGMASQGLGAEVDAELADASALSAARERITSDAALSVARARLAHFTGNADATVSGSLDPLGIEGQGAPRPEVLAARDDRDALARRLELSRRLRVPNPTLSLFTQNDGFNERVLGVGLSIPVPLPQPLGRTHAGEVAEFEALQERATAAGARLEHELELERTLAQADFDAATRARALFSPARVAQLSARLDALTAEVKAGRLVAREALLLQRALVEQLQADIDVRAATCTASVRLRLAAGLTLEGGSL